MLDERFPGAAGRLHRARMLASRAMLEHSAGEPHGACETLARCFEEAGAQADQIVRVHWPRLRPVLWHALAEGQLEADAVVPAMRDAFPGGEALVEMIDHPDPAVRRSALLTALAAGHPAVLGRLAELGKDADAQVARRPPPRPSAFEPSRRRSGSSCSAASGSSGRAGSSTRASGSARWPPASCASC